MKKIVVGFVLMIGLTNLNMSRAVGTMTVSPCQASFTFTVSGHIVNFTNTSGSDSASSMSFQWAFGVSSNSSNQNNPTYTYGAAGTYTVCLFINDTACHSNPFMTFCDTVRIDTIINPTLPPPIEYSSSSVITPNGDGIDDVVQLAISGRAIKIYNRFGILVRVLDRNIWDGEDDGGVLVPMGYYTAINEETNTFARISVIR